MLNTSWRLHSRPSGLVERDHFDVRTEPVPEPAPGHVVVRNIYLMVPASMRIWMDAEDTYLPAQPLGEVMRGITLGVVEHSESERLPVGTHVTGMGGWQEYSVGPERAWTALDPHPDIGLTAYLGVLDLQGLTAYYGLTDVGRPAAGETLVVTAAAGSVGSLVCQIGKKLGLRVIGIAGGPAKCAWLRDSCGVDDAIDYKGEDVAARLDELCPDGIDIAFENVGGPIMDLIIDRINTHARIALCGMVSTYNGNEQTAGRSLMNLVNKRGRIQGFIVRDYMSRRAEFREIVTPWLLDGSLIYREEFSTGLHSTPAAMNRLARGQNTGLQFVRVTSPVD
ncbi:NADP-dependent oxidoreductase [Mycobacterium sp. TNTM28]|uniref:NADP-dependent oxidoreductase n=1 Tax=[Mycobacterium] fortunisiensis TaxID=2600579 RepID=A0ABS6KJP0_9MYCO|nr:NADP-dependent oxidoreductase [[Mycobacterium] fortunisiensis]